MVLDRGNLSFSNPVDVSNDNVRRGIDFHVGSLGDLEGQVDSIELSLGQISELVDSHLVGAFRVGVVLLNLYEVSQEDILSVGLFSLSGVPLAEVTLVLFERVGLRSSGLEVVKVEGGRADEHERNEELFVHKMIINLSIKVQNLSELLNLNGEHGLL